MFRVTALTALLALAGCAQGDPITTGGTGSGGTGASGQGGEEPTGVTSAETASSSSGASCDEDPCKLMPPQCGCDAGQQCTVDAQGDRICAVDGTVDAGGGCDETAFCQAGNMCVGFTPGLTTCLALCESDADCSGPGGHCLYTLDDGSGGDVPGVLMCSTSCDPIANTGCSVPGMACRFQIDSSDDTLFTHCFVEGTTVYPDECETSDDCAAGHVCWDTTAGTKLCFAWCDTGNDQCDGAATCQAVNFTEGVPLEYDGVTFGLCSE